MKVAAKLPTQTYAHSPDYNAVQLPQSDQIMSRTISMQIKLTWTQAEVEQRMHNLKKVLS
jgi:8-amino-3,8-dideoxy-alpha-D-manno-octulosonate transaminase